MRGDLFDVQTYAIHDGPGIRTAVFFRGCPLRCTWCHNPESWSPPPAGGGPGPSARELVDRLLADQPFFEDSGGGVTFTGGEPTTQPAFLMEAAALLKAEGIHTALETCGYFRPALCATLAGCIDLFLFDIKHADPDRHKEATGVGNARIFENLGRLIGLAGPDRMVPRIPVVPGFNGSPEDVGEMLSVLGRAGYAGDVHLMPYHDWARHKYDELGLPFHDFGPLDPGVRQAIDKQFEGRELCPVWGGGA